MIVGAELEAHLLPLLAIGDGEAAFHRLPRAVLDLIDHRLVEAKLRAAAHGQHQIAVGCQSGLGAIEAQLDRRGIRARRNHKVVLQLSAMSVIDQVYAGVDTLHAHLAVHRHIVLPLGGVVSGEVVRFAGLKILSAGLLRVSSSEQAHPHGAGADAGLHIFQIGRSPFGRDDLVHLQHSVIAGEKERILWSPRQPLHIAGGLAEVRLKAEGQLAVVNHSLSRRGGFAGRRRCGVTGLAKCGNTE